MIVGASTASRRLHGHLRVRHDGAQVDDTSTEIAWSVPRRGRDWHQPGLPDRGRAEVVSVDAIKPGSALADAVDPARERDRRPRARGRMRFEVELTQEEPEVFRAIAVAYPNVTATGRTEKEALGLLMEAMERYMKDEARKGPTPPAR